MGSYAVAAAMAGGDVRLTKARAELIGSLTDKMIEAGVDVSPTADGVRIKRDPKQRLKAVDVETAIYPGFRHRSAGAVHGPDDHGRRRQHGA